MTDDSYYEALKKCAIRYDQKLVSIIDEYDYWGWPEQTRRHKIIELKKFIAEIRSGIDQRFPLIKLNRWIGYVQGVLIAYNYTTVDNERDFTRPLFRPLDFPNEN